MPGLSVSLSSEANISVENCDFNMPLDLILIEDYAMLYDVMQSSSFISVIFDDALTGELWGQLGVQGSDLLHLAFCT